MRTMISIKSGYSAVVLLMATMVFAPAAMAQISIDVEDVPMEAGEVFHYYVEADTNLSDTLGIAVEIDPPGGNYTWDFRNGPLQSITADSLIDPLTAPHIDSIPDANRVIYSETMMGMFEMIGYGYRYENLADDGLNAVGFGIILPLEDGDFNLGIPFDEVYPVSPMPLEYGDEWDITQSVSYVFQPDTSEWDYEAEIEMGGYNEVDAWGTAQYFGGESDVLRVHTFAAGEFTLYVIVEIPPFPPVRIPVYNQVFPATHSYVWIAPGIGEVARINSMGGEEEALFTDASTIRRYFTADWSAPERDAEIPESITLLPIYPNPFNATANISYVLPSPGQVQLEVLDILGRRVHMLENGIQSAGTHAATWNAENFASGIYFVRLHAGNTSSARKITLVK